MLFRAGLRRLLEAEPGFEVVGEATEGEETVRRVRELAPDILLLDLAMPGVPGLEALRQLDECRLAGAHDPAHRGHREGGAGEGPPARRVGRGHEGVGHRPAVPEHPQRERGRILGRARPGVGPGEDAARDHAAGPRASESRKKTFGLTPRELEITATIAAGYSNKEIAQKFTISEDTVKHHLSNIFDKTGVSSRLELALFAVNHQLVEST